MTALTGCYNPAMIIKRLSWIFIVGAWTCTAFGTAAAPCDRACLKTTLHQYLTAMLAHKPSSAPLSIGFRQTENSVVQRNGMGLWETTLGLGEVQRRYYDPETEQAGFFGLLEVPGGLTIATLRLRVEDRKITEAEWVLSRKGDPGLGPNGGQQADAAYHDPAYLVAHPPPAERIVPKAERLSRTDLIAVTNTYFDGLSAHDGKQILAYPGCIREENGVLTTQRALQGGGLSDCTSEGAMANIFAVTARRYPIVDEEAQAVLGIVLFQRKPGVAMRRNLLSEWFFIEQGKIRTIFASMYYPEQEAMIPNWPPFDGNWPIQPPTK
jgi:hypothetical protein